MLNTQDAIYEAIYGEIVSGISHIPDIRIDKHNRHKSFSIISDSMEMTIFLEKNFVHVLATSHYRRTQLNHSQHNHQHDVIISDRKRDDKYSQFDFKNSSKMYDMYSKNFPSKMMSDIISYLETKEPSQASLYRPSHD